MDSKTLYNIKVFEKLGAPLMNAVLRASYNSDKPVSADNAKQIANLISTAVKMSQGLSASFNPKDEDDIDALRLALACMVSPVIAENFAKTEKDLSDEDIKKIRDIYDQILSFTDGFTSAKDAANRRISLATPDPLSVSDRLLFDEEQIILQGMNALLPVVIRVSEYSFGRDQRELLNEITKKLSSQAKVLVKSLYGVKLEKDDQKLAELGILRSLSDIYSSCHYAERRRIDEMTGIEKEDLLEGGEIPLDNLWKMFETRFGLMVALTKTLIEGEANATSASAVAPKQTPVSKAIPEKPIAAPAPAAEKPASEAPAEPSAEEKPAEFNPMSAFAKKNAS